MKDYIDSKQEVYGGNCLECVEGCVSISILRILRIKIAF